jgi:hypothetical protein
MRRILWLASSLVLIAALLATPYPLSLREALSLHDVARSVQALGIGVARSPAVSALRRNLHSFMASVGLKSFLPPEGSAEAAVVPPPATHVSPTRQEADELFEVIGNFSPPFTAALQRLHGSFSFAGSKAGQEHLQQQGKGASSSSSSSTLSVSADKLFQRALIQYLMSNTIIEADIAKNKEKKDKSKKNAAVVTEENEDEADARVQRARLVRHKAAFLVQSFSIDYANSETPEAHYKASVLRYLRRAIFQ